MPVLSLSKRQTIKSPENPLDKCTLVSIFPEEIVEVKHTLHPGKFVIPAGTYEKPSLTIIGTSCWWKDLGEEEPLLEITQNSMLIANSIIIDYCNGLIECNMADAMPGLFFVPGKVSMIELMKEHKGLLDKARDNQHRWYIALIKLADSMWSRSNGNPLTINDLQRLAARALGQNTKEWLADFQLTETVRCVACGALRNPQFPICQTCKTIVDAEKYEKSGLKQAK